MKKEFLFVLVTLMSISLCGCQGGAERGNDSTQNMTQEFEREKTEDGHYIVSEEELATYITRVEITEENWKDYINFVEISNGCKKLTYKDYFSCQACGFFDFEIELELVETGDTIIADNYIDTFQCYNSVTREYIIEDMYTIEDFEGKKIKGELYILSGLPEELWFINDRTGSQMVYMEGSREPYSRTSLGNNLKQIKEGN